MKSYDIIKDGYAVGTADIESEGLYLKIQASCCPPDTQIYKLVLFCGSRRIDLGICVPEESHFCVRKRILRRLVEGEMLQFVLEEKEFANHDLFIPLDPEKPFDYVDCLMKARFEKKGVNYGVVIARQ